MNSNGRFILGLLAGAAIGSVVTWKVLKTKYEQILEADLEREIAELKARYEKNEVTTEEESSEEDDLDDIEEYENIVKTKGYFHNEHEKEGGNDMTPYVISPDEFDTIEYDTVNLTYYADGVLVNDSDDEVIEDVEDLVGPDALDSFGEYEEDSVFVRDDALGIDYEICKDTRTYVEVVGADYPEEG
jgi:hypothetical protein